MKQKKKQVITNNNAIYCFYSFDDFCNYSSYLNKQKINLKTIAKNIALYEYNENYYLTFSNLNFKNLGLNKILAIITEFATYTNNNDLFMRKLIENGKIMMKNNAIETAIKYFCKK